MPYKDKEKKKAYQKEYFQKNKHKIKNGDDYRTAEERRAYHLTRHHARKHLPGYKEMVSKSSRKGLLKSYGLTLEGYDAMVLERQNKCDICSSEVVKLVVDHCHTTNKVRGLLCSQCNVMLGMAKDSIENLRRAIEYLGRNAL